MLLDSCGPSNCKVFANLGTKNLAPNLQLENLVALFANIKHFGGNLYLIAITLCVVLENCLESASF